MKLSKKVRAVALIVALTSLFFANTASASGRITINDRAMVKTNYTVKVGSTVTLVLHSMYWSLTPPSSTASLKSNGDPVQTPIMPGPNAPAGCGVPGSGCGTQVWKFTATKVGVTHLLATRDSCGEAMQCTGDQGKFAVTVKVIK